MQQRHKVYGPVELQNLAGRLCVGMQCADIVCQNVNERHIIDFLSTCFDFWNGNAFQKIITGEWNYFALAFINE